MSASVSSPHVGVWLADTATADTTGGGAGTDGRNVARSGDRPGDRAVRTERRGEER